MPDRDQINPARYRSLTRKMVIFVVSVSILPLLITGVLTLTNFSQAYKGKIESHLRELVQKHSQNIDTYLMDRLSEIRIMARSYPVERLMDRGFLRERLALLREEYSGAFVDLGLVAADGTQVAYVGPFQLKMADYSKSKWFQEAMQKEDYISGVFTGLRGTPHFIVAAKINCGQKCYLVKATINFQAFQALVENITIGNTGFAFIINRQGKYQTKPRYPVSLEHGPYEDMLAGRFDLKRIPVFQREDAGGNDALFAFAPLKEGNWILCLQQEAGDAYSDMYSTVILAVSFIIFCTAVILPLSLYLSRRLVTRIRKSDEQKATINEKVIETGRLASIGELAAGIAHEINNPVAIMVEEAGWIEDILSEDKPISEEDLAEIERAVQQIKTQGSRCKEITYKLLSFARKIDPTVKEVHLNELVEEVVGLLSQKSRFATVQIETDLDPELPIISASPSELQQVILNLMNNAVDSIGKGGGIVTVGTKRLGDSIELVVSDTGEGIPEANLSRIFDPFFTTKPVGHGTGLGLSICYGIIKKMGGEISVRSIVELGTTFSLVLPIVAAPTKNPKNSNPSDSDSGAIK